MKRRVDGGAPPGPDDAARVPTSVVLQDLLREVPAERVSLAWTLGYLCTRSFGVIMLLLALIGLVPGVASIIGILLAMPAIQIILSHKCPVLPRMLARRTVPRASRGTHYSGAAPHGAPSAPVSGS